MQLLSTGLLLFTVLASVASCDRREAQPQPPVASAPTSFTPGTAEAPRVVDITVGDTGYAPAKVPAKAGETLRLRFTRTTESECVKEIMVPDRDVLRDLPMNTPVDVDVQVKDSDVAFMCGMKMVKGAIVVGD